MPDDETSESGLTLAGSQTIQETASTAAASQARAAVEARYVVAAKFPRDFDTVRQRILKDCKRPRFAEVARYHKPIGNNRVVGPSIRFAETALRAMGNTLQEAFVLYDDNDKRILKVAVTDLEANETYTQDLVITKTVERKTLRLGQRPISKRTNSYGETVYLVEATEDDFKTKQAAQVSIALRTLALRLIPSDIIEESMDQVVATLQDTAARDPDAERKAIADGFATLNVAPADLGEYLGHDLGKCTPAELVELRGIYATIRDGETSWVDVLEQKLEDEGRASKAKAKRGPRGRGTAAVKQAIKQSTASDVEQPSDDIELPDWGR